MPSFKEFMQVLGFNKPAPVEVIDMTEQFDTRIIGEYVSGEGFVERTLVRNSIGGFTNSGAVRNAYRKYGDLTCDEVEFVTGLPHQTASAIIYSLRKRGVVQRTPRRRFTRHGGLAIAETLTN